MTEIAAERWNYPRFFTENIDETAVVSGEDAKHISQVLRMRGGDFAVLCDGRGRDYLCRLSHVGAECVFDVLESAPNPAEPTIYVRLFQAMPKGDKMDFIVQKAVECGASEIIPIMTKRCVSRPDAKQLAKKTERWNRIAYEAAKQCGRGIIPKVGETADISALKNMLSPDNTGILFYECAFLPLKKAVGEIKRNVDIVIGSEGGFEPAEAEALAAAGFIPVSLGKRILRCETAPIAALCVLMNITDNM
ncbi:MAG: 16S rRNA (uracil(1498)-N(3))-methyltransferase [Oscillospiraceae bacterium]